MEGINKPVSVAIHDCKEDIIEAINKHQLPASILLLIIKDVLSDVESLDRQTYMKDLETYKRDLDIAAGRLEEEADGEH